MAIDLVGSGGATLPDTFDPKLPNTPAAMLELQQASTADNMAAAVTSFIGNIPNAAGGVIASIGDAFASSLIPGVNKDDFKDWLQQNGGDFGRYYNEHNAGLQMAGGMLGALLPGVLAIKTVRAGGWVAGLAKRTLGEDAAAFVTSTGKSNTELFEGLYQQARLRGEASVVTNLARDPKWLPAKGMAMARSVGDTLVEGAAAEAAIAATMHNNTFLFPEEMTFGDHLAWSLGTQAVVGGVAGLIAKRTMKRGIDAAFAAGRGDAIGDVQRLASDALGNVVDARGPALTAYAQIMNDANLQSEAARVKSDQLVVDSGLSMATGAAVRIRDIGEHLLRDSPIPNVSKSHSFNDAQLEPQIKTLTAGLKEEPTMGAGIRSLEAFDTRTAPQDLATARQIELDKQKAELADMYRDIKALRERPVRTMRENAELSRLENKYGDLYVTYGDLRRTVPIVHEIDGTMSSPSTRAGIFQDGQRKFDTAGFNNSQLVIGDKELTATAAGHVLLDDAKGKTLKLTVNDLEAFDINAVNGAEQTLKQAQLTQEAWRDMTHFERTAVQDLLQHQAERTNPSTMRAPIKLDANSHHTQIDYAIKMVNTWKDAAWLHIEGAATMEELEHMAVRSKFFDYQFLRNRAVLGNEPDLMYRHLDNVARALNLPRNNHSLLLFLESNRQTSGPLVDMALLAPDHDRLKFAVKTAAGVPTEEQLANTGISSFTGSQFSLPRDRKPVLSLMRNLKDNGAVNAADLSRMVTTVRSAMVAKLRNTPDTLVIKSMLESFDNMPDVISAFKNDIHNLTEGNALDGAVLKNFLQQPFRYRETNAYKTASLLQDITDKHLDKQIEELLKSKAPWGKLDAQGAPLQSHQDIWSELSGRGNEYDMDMFHAFRHARGAGWDVADVGFVPANVQTPSGENMWHVQLADTQRNRDIWRAMFDNDMPKGALMPMSGKQQLVAVSDKARASAMSIDALSQQLLHEHNAIQQSLGLQTIKKMNLHMPAQDMTQVARKVIVDGTGRHVFTIGGVTPAQAAKNADAEVQLARTHGRELYVLDESDVERFKYANAESWFEMADFSKPSNQTGPAKGTSFGGVIRTGNGEFNSIIEGMLRQYSDLGRRMRSTLMEPQINYMRMQKTATGLSPEAKTVFDDVISALAGTQNLDKESIVGKTLLYAETTYDKLLANTFDAISNAKDVLPRYGFSERKYAKRVENAQSRFPVQFQPFKSVEDYMTATMPGQAVGTLRKHAAALNKLTAEVSIRMFDIGMVMTNYMSLAATLPAVTASLGKRANEVEADWLRRIGAYGSATPNGNYYFSGTKALTTGIHMRFQPEGRDILQRAGRLGLLEQSVAEQEEIFGRVGESVLPQMWTKFANKASKLTDWSEKESRAIPFLSFYKIGKDGLGLEDHAAMLFAHQQSNNVIADFRPSSRPAIFQGAAGMPLGLFTTYMWNYTQRMVDMIETAGLHVGKGYSSPLAKQLALQGSLFGAQSLPGWDQFTGHFMSNYDKSNTPADRLNTAMGHTAADVFLNGTISNLPKMFGADDGIGVGARNSVGLPFQYGVGLQGAAGLRFIAKAGTMLGQMLDSIAAEHGVDPVRMAEIYAQANINKLSSNMVEWTVGHSLDSQGNVIEQDTRTLMGTASRILGFKPLFADEARQENSRNRVTDRIQGELLADLGQRLRSKFRNGSLSSNETEDALTDYVKAGGSQPYFGRFLQSQLILGTQDKTSREIAKALHGSIDQNRVGRLLYLQRD